MSPHSRPPSRRSAAGRPSFFAVLPTSASMAVPRVAEKTVGLMLEPLRYATRVANFTAVFFRRSTPQITNPGGLWDESQNFYPRLGGIPHVGMREWRWPRAGRIKFSHLQFDSTVYAWPAA